MKYILIVAIIFYSFKSFAQQEIKLDDVKNHVGDSVKLIAKIYSGKTFETSNGTKIFLNVGGNYPDAPLTLVIPDDVKNQFKNPPEIFYKGKEEWITGKVELYKEKPQIVIHDSKQIYDVAAP